MSMKVSDQLVQSMPWLDQVSDTIKTVSEPVAGESAPAAVKDALVGTWLGHPLHPAIVLAPIGFWSSALVLDLAGQEEAADLMVASGLISATGAALSGAAQYYDATTNEKPRRLGALHALTNTVALGLYGASLLARKSGNRKAGKVLSTAGFATVMAGGYLGGDLSYDLGIGVDHAAFEEPPTEWTDAAALADLQPGVPKRVELDGAAVMLLSHDDGIHAIGAVCPHLGGPLDEGKIQGHTVTCPWHGSQFCIADGKLERGPASAPVTAYDVKVEGGRVYVKEFTGPGDAPQTAPAVAGRNGLVDSRPAPPPATADWTASDTASG